MIERVAASIAGGLARPLGWLARPAPAAGLLLLMMTAFLINGAVGLDFGTHWDEWYHVKGVASCVDRLSLLPDALSYGGPYFTLGLAVVLADRWRDVLGMLHDLQTLPRSVDVGALPSSIHFKSTAQALLATSDYLVRVRAVFLALSALSILWVYLAALRCWPRRYGVALAGAAFMGLSWEFGFHSRWVAIDAPLTMFCALELFLFCGVWQAVGPATITRWYAGLAAASGAVFACKLTGAFAFLPVLLTPFLLRRIVGLRARVLLATLGCLAFLLVSFALSPASYLDPLHFLNVLRSGSADYNNIGPTYPYYVGFFEHVWRLLLWLAAVVPSPFPAVAVAFTALVLGGLANLLRRETRMTLTWLVFLISFGAVFTHNHLLIVRQYLMFIPFLALCFARGAGLAWDGLRVRTGRPATMFVVVVAAAFVANGVFETKKAWRITRDTADTIAAEAARDLLKDRRPVRMSRVVQDRLASRLGASYACRPAEVTNKTISHFLAFQQEHKWMANRVRVFRKVYGGGEANMNDYTDWAGRLAGVRIVDVSMDVMTALGRNMSVDVDCSPATRGPRG